MRTVVYVGRILLPAGHWNLKVRIINTASKPQRLTNGTCLGNLSPLASGYWAANGDQGGSVADVSGTLPLTERAVTQPLMDYWISYRVI